MSKQSATSDTILHLDIGPTKIIKPEGIRATPAVYNLLLSIPEKQLFGLLIDAQHTRRKSRGSAFQSALE
jgi:hypothetical protein